MIPLRRPAKGSSGRIHECYPSDHFSNTKKTTLRVAFSHARSSQSIQDLLPSSFALEYFWTTTTFLRGSFLVVFQAEIADLDHGDTVADVNAI